MPKNFLKQIRQEQDITSSALARKIGVTPQLLWNFENERGNISNDVTQKILSELKVSYEYLMSGIRDNQVADNKQKIMLKAVQIAHVKFAQKNFSETEMIEISTKIYERLIEIEEEGIQINDEFIDSLKGSYFSGLADSCLMEFFSSKTTLD